jgi:signal peptidase II
VERGFSFLYNKAMQNPVTRSHPGAVWELIYLAVVAEIVLWMDLGSKYLVRNQLQAGQAVDYELGPQGFVMLVHLPNSGMALGMFKDYNLAFTLIGLAAAVVIVTVDLAFFRRINLGRFGLALVLGGLLGNLIDRFALGYVTDIFMFAGLPVFNIADVCILVGVLYMIIDLIRKERMAQI